MPRKGQRDFRPTAVDNRNLDIIKTTDTIESSTTLAVGEETIFTMTTASDLGVPIFVQEDISLFQGSIAEANLIPNGSNVDASNYQVIGPFRDQSSGDGNNIVSKIYVRNASFAATDFTKRIGAATEDGYIISGFAWTTGGDLTVGKTNGSSFTAGIRPVSVTIPQGATINSAKITLNPIQNDADTPDVTIKGIDEDNTASFSSDPTGRDTTTATVNWTIPSTTEDVPIDSPSIVTIVQEIVDRVGWTSGNAMGFLIDDNGSASNEQVSFDSYDNTPAKAALLTVNYGVGTSKTVLFQGRTRYITPRDDVTIT